MVDGHPDHHYWYSADWHNHGNDDQTTRFKVRPNITVTVAARFTTKKFGFKLLWAKSVLLTLHYLGSSEGHLHTLTAHDLTACILYSLAVHCTSGGQSLWWIWMSQAMKDICHWICPGHTRFWIRPIILPGDFKVVKHFRNLYKIWTNWMTICTCTCTMSCTQKHALWLWNC